jgi:hypothetical protein
MLTTQEGTVGQASKNCSNEWKTRPIDRYCRSLGFTGGHTWIGFSIDEFQRMRAFDKREKWNHVYPLVDRKMTRGDCIALVKRMDWPTPPRSSCWMCPYRSDAEWLHLKRTDPADFDAAVALENQVRAVDPNMYLHRSGVPLSQATLGENQSDLFGQCDSGACFT